MQNVLLVLIIHNYISLENFNIMSPIIKKLEINYLFVHDTHIFHTYVSNDSLIYVHRIQISLSVEYV